MNTDADEAMQSKAECVALRARVAELERRLNERTERTSIQLDSEFGGGRGA